MKKDISKSSTVRDDDMRPEYDFRGAVRGKHYKPLHKGYSVHIHKPDGTTVVEHYRIADGTVMLQPDVRKHFPDSESVNTALRLLITLISEMPGKSKISGRKARSVKLKSVTRSRSKSLKA